MLLRRLAVPALLVPAVLAAAGPASAAGGLEPGGSETLSIQLPSSWARQADQLGISTIGLSQSENGCLPPEVRAGDSSCGDDGGDLAGQLIAEVAAGSLDGHECRVTTVWAPLDLLHPAVQSRLAVSGPQCLAVRLSFPSDGNDNVAQSDALTFDLRTVAVGPGDGVSATQLSTGTTSGAGAAPGNRGRAVGSQQAGTAPGAAPAQPAGTTASGPATSAEVVGEATTAVQVGSNSIAVRTESSNTPILGQVLAWGALLLALVAVGLLLVLRRGRRARQEAS
jgi:hypothetical protein